MSKRKTYSQNLVDLRKIHGLTQEELAKRIKIKRCTIAAYEESRNEPDISTTKKIISYFKISADDLYYSSIRTVLRKRF